LERWTANHPIFPIACGEKKIASVCETITKREKIILINQKVSINQSAIITSIR
jgi:hypothetical protein